MKETPYLLKTSEVNLYGYMPPKGKLEIEWFCGKIRINVHGGYLATIPEGHLINIEFGDYAWLQLAKQVEEKNARRTQTHSTARDTDDVCVY